MGSEGWQWDELLYRGSADYYAHGRLPYPPEIADVLREHLRLDGSGRPLDVGCGPGSLALLLAPLFELVVGVDADEDMLRTAEREAERRGIANVVWVHRKAEDLDARLGVFRVVTFAQSFHWMDRARVAAILRDLLEADGAWVHVGAMTHQGVGSGEGLPWPMPPRKEISCLVDRYLGPVRRAGRGARPDPVSGEEQVMVAAGYRGPVRVDVGGGRVFERSEDDVVASVYSLSYAAPHLFGERLGEFEAELRALLRSVSPAGVFSERQREVELAIWRR